MKTVRQVLMTGAAFVCVGLPAAALAQQGPAAEDAAPTGAGDIVVTAQRRSEALERTPVAVSVISGTSLAKQAIVTESDLQSATPGLTIRAGQNSNQLNYALRGQSLDAFSDTRPGVLPYFDEVQHASCETVSAAPADD